MKDGKQVRDSWGNGICREKHTALISYSLELRNPVSFHSNRIPLIRLRGFSLLIWKPLGLVEDSCCPILRNMKFGEFSSPFSSSFIFVHKKGSAEHLFGVTKHHRVLCLTISFLLVDISENSFLEMKKRFLQTSHS